MLSMTGFASSSVPLGAGQVVMEVRSLNHRFLEVRVRMPQDLNDQAFFVEQHARDRLERGRYDIGIRLEGPALAPPEFDIDRARTAYEALSRLRDQVAPGTELPVSSIIALPDLLVASAPRDHGEVRGALTAALALALTELDEMRQREGNALAVELRRRLESARASRDAIAKRSEDVVEQARARLRERLERLLGDTSVPLDPGRLESEVAVLADRSDITEEITRLSSHFDQFERLIDATEPVGRRLDFLLQEIAREANTVGAKSQDAPLAHLVVELKAETERMREQVQNVL
jgi:uncharacterized protein (TIGR00255 family)